MTHVWPAIALGRVGEVLAGFLVEALPASSAVRLAAALAGAPHTAGVSAISPPSATRDAAPNSDGFPLPAGGEISQVALIALLTALVAVFVFTVRGEIRTVRWPR